MRGICSRENERLPGLRLDAGRRRPELAQPLDGAGKRELRPAETLDEVPATARPEGLERAELAVHRAVAAAHALAAHPVARHDPLALEEKLRQGAAIRLVGEERSGERPATLRRRGSRHSCAREPSRPPVDRRKVVPPGRAERRPGVVRHLAGPDEVPERRQGCLPVEAARGEELGPEDRPGRSERGADRDVLLSLGSRLSGRLAELRRVLAEVEGDAVEPGARPDDLARGAEDVEVGRAIALHPPRKHVALPERDRERERLQRDERLAERLPAPDPVPRGQEAAESRLLRRLDLAPEHGERGPPDAAEDVRVAPFALRAAGSELTAHEALCALELLELRLDASCFETEARRRPRRS